MTGPAGNWHYARSRHLRICREDEWGACPGAPQWQAVPLYGEGFTLKAANARFRPDTLFGGWRRSVHLGYAVEVAGELTSLAWPQVVEALLGLALDREQEELHSYCADYYTPADPRRCVGVMADGLRVRAPLGGGDVALLLSLKAKSEELRPALTEQDFDYGAVSPVPFRFDRAAIALDGAPVTDVEAFGVEVGNHLSVGPNHGGSPAYMTAAGRAVSLEITALDDGGAVNEAIRSSGTMSFQAELAHPEGHSLTLALPVLHPEKADEAAWPSRLVRSSVRLEAGTDAEGQDITYTVNLIG